MVRIQLYTQPRDLKPMLNKKAYLTNVGYALINTLKEMGEDPKANITNTSEGRLDADIIIKCRHLTIAMALRELSPSEKVKDPQNTYLLIEVEGDRYSSYTLIKEAYRKLKYKPYELTMPESFTVRTGVTAAEVKNEWIKILSNEPKKEILRRYNALKKILARSKRFGVDPQEIAEINGKIKRALDKKDYASASSLITMGRNSITEKITRYQQNHIFEQDARREMDRTASAIADAEAAGFDTSHEKEMLKKAETLRDSGEFRGVMELCRHIQSELIEKASRMEHLKSKITSMETRISEAKDNGIDVNEVDSLLSRCWLYYREKDISTLEKLLSEINVRLEKSIQEKQMLLSQYEVAKQKLKDATFTLIETKKQGLRTEKLEKELARGEKLIFFNEYQQAADIATNIVNEARGMMENRENKDALLNDLRNTISMAKLYIDTKEFQRRIDNMMEEGLQSDTMDIINALQTLKNEINREVSSANPVITVEFPEWPMDVGQWVNQEVTVRNTGRAHAKNIELLITGTSFTKPEKIDVLKSGESTKLVLGVRSEKEGKVAITYKVTYQRELDGKKYSDSGHMYFSFKRPGFKLEETMEVGKKVELAQEIERDDATRNILNRITTLEPSLTYYVDGDVNIIYRIASVLVKKGDNVLIVTRQFPKKVQMKYKIAPDTCRIIWLSKEEQGEDCIKPNDLEKLRHEIVNFMENNTAPYVILDGLEYLSVHNKFEYVIKFIQSITDKIAINNAISIIAFDQQALGHENARLLIKECDENLIE